MFRLTLFTREEWRSARNCKRDSQAREAASMFQVRCHENSLMLGIRRSQIVLTFTLICFGNDFLHFHTKGALALLNEYRKGQWQKMQPGYLSAPVVGES
jgi:hypothetical protein